MYKSSINLIHFLSLLSMMIYFIISVCRFGLSGWFAAHLMCPTIYFWRRNNRACKIIQTCSIERKPFIEVPQHYEIWARVPQLVILEARIDCRSSLNPMLLGEFNDLMQRFWFWQDFIQNRWQNHRFLCL